MNVPDNNIQAFLHALVTHNNREWFKANKDWYNEVWAEFNRLVENLIGEIATFDPSVAYLTPKDCIYRIYRDIRFSQDKTPYKGHLGAFINERGKKAYYGGYYLQIEPMRIMLAGGVWWLPTPEMHALRHAIVDQVDTFHRIMQAPELQKLHPNLGLNYYKKIPAGYPKDFPYPEYLFPKEYAIWFELPSSVLKQKNIAHRIASCFKAIKPLNDFLSENVEINLEEMESMKDVVKFL